MLTESPAKTLGVERLRKWLLIGLTAFVSQLTPGSALGELIGPSALILTDLNPKTLPIAFDADADPKDVKYKSRTTYKPATVTTGGAKKDVRLLMLGKKDDAALRAVMQQQIRATEMDYRIRLAFDPNKLTGLVDGASLGFFEFVLLDDVAAEGVAPVRRIEAVYNAKVEGYTVRATDGSTPLGTEFDVLDEEVVLRLRLEAGSLHLEAGRPTGPFVTDINTTELYSEVLGDEGEGTLHTFAWGVSGLGKKAQLYFNLLTLWGPLPDIGAAETLVADQLMSAVLIAGNTLFPKDVISATDNIEATRALLAQAVTDLSAAVEGDQLGATAEGARALKSAMKALKLAEKAKASGDKLIAAGKTNPKALAKKARAIAMRGILSLVQVGGFRSNSTKKALKTAKSF